MSVVIKGVEAPISCNKCFCCDDDARFCMAKQEYIPTFGKPDWCPLEKPKWCPLVELPEKHGRLIDESIVLEMIRKSMGIKDLSFLYHAEKSIVNEIYHAPTVIDAEGE